MNSTAGILAIATLVAGGVAAAAPPTAQALTPPPIDEVFLPPPAVPAPPHSTRQRHDCTAGAFRPEFESAASQLDGIDLPALWQLTTGTGQTVAVIDTGVAGHPRLPRLRSGGDYVSTGDGLQDCDGHGTLVAGIIGAVADPAGPAFAGVAPGVSIIGVRQSSTKYEPAHGGGSGVGDVDTLARAVRTAADMGATVINVSSVACVAAAHGLDDRALGAAIAYAVDVRDAVVVAAAGNVGAEGQCPRQNPTPTSAHPTAPDWDTPVVAVSPGWYDEYVLTVASVSVDGSPSPFSLAGPWVDVAAPGEAVVSLSPTGGNLVNSIDGVEGEEQQAKPVSGTSYAAPVVSGIAALVRDRFPQLSARQVMARIETTARRPSGGWNPLVGNGAVDAIAAVSDDPPPPPRRLESGDQPRVESPDPPAEHDTAATTAAFTGLAGCVAVLAVLLGALVPANRLAGRRRAGAAGKQDVVGR